MRKEGQDAEGGRAQREAWEPRRGGGMEQKGTGQRGTGLRVYMVNVPLGVW